MFSVYLINRVLQSYLTSVDLQPHTHMYSFYVCCRWVLGRPGQWVKRRAGLTYVESGHRWESNLGRYQALLPWLPH